MELNVAGDRKNQQSLSFSCPNFDCKKKYYANVKDTMLR